MQTAYTLDEVPSGVYRHFKGNTYHILGVATDYRGEKFASYIPQKGTHAGKLSHRPLAMFLETVDKPELSYSGGRFTLISTEDILGPLVIEKIDQETGYEGDSDVILGQSEHTETGQHFILTATMRNGSPVALNLRTP